MSRNSRNTALKAVSSLVLVTALAACSDLPLTQPSDLSPQSAQHDASITSTLVCANPSNTTVLNSPLVGNINFAPNSQFPAFNIDPNAAYGTLGGSALWIGPFENSGQTNVPVGTYVFTTTFTALEGDRVSGSILADNGATITIGGNTLLPIGATLSTDQPLLATFQTPTGFNGVLNGQNTVTVALYNSGFSPGNTDPNPTGVSYCFTVLSCPAAPAIANAYLKANNIPNNSTKGKLIISAVAKAMGPGATFPSGAVYLGKCDPGYAAAVAAFIVNL